EGGDQLRMAFLVWLGTATAALPWDVANEQPPAVWKARYWNAPNANLIPNRAPDYAADEESIDHDWGQGSPDPSIGNNRFVARWTRTLSLEPGDYEFAATADDGVRLWVD